MADKFYWLKLNKDFFKRHDIRIIEAMPNGKDYILFYLKLLCESVSHDGNLRFSEQVPYNEEMLSIVTNTNVDIVRSAVKAFAELNMLEILDDGTFYMAEVEKMIGSAVNNDNANRQRRFREKQKALQITERYESVTNNNESKSKSKSKNNIYIPPTLEEVEAYCRERGNNVDPKAFYDYYSVGDWKDQSGKPVRNWKQKMIAVWEKDKPKKKGGFTDFKQSNTDYASIEEMLLKR